ncbi:hypothetical protein ACFFRR_005823 [Megaselia abdita]
MEARMFRILFIFCITLIANAQIQLFWTPISPKGLAIQRTHIEENNKQNSYADVFLQKLSESNAIIRNTLNLRKKRLNEDEEYNLIRIYGPGQEYSFPPALELIIQRLQSKFSVYKFHDESRPVKVSLSDYTQPQNISPV